VLFRSGALLLLVRRRGWRAEHAKDDLQQWIAKSDYEKTNA
jgi:hypothetical protein